MCNARCGSWLSLIAVVIRHIGVTWGGERETKGHPSIFSHQRRGFCGYWVWRGANKNWGEIERTGCMYIKDWFKTNLPLFLTWLLRKLKFLILMVDFAPSPNVTCQAMLIIRRSLWRKDERLVWILRMLFCNIISAYSLSDFCKNRYQRRNPVQCVV
jgi:hypothetical protein